jgi:hypothetical protein
VWDLLTRDFYWEIPSDFAVRVYEDQGPHSGVARLQVFEVAVAAIFASLRPEYEWYVTPNRPDGGLDFVGKHHFLTDETLGIAATITVGGQCKKRTTVNDIVGEVAGSLARMASTLDPTFFVVALSARLNPKRIGEARDILERAHQRHCHILDRSQIEGLIRDHLPVVKKILSQGLCESEIEEVLTYFDMDQEAQPSTSVSVKVPERVLAGVPFSIQLSIRSSVVSGPASRMWWMPEPTASTEPQPLTLIGPIGADEQDGVELTPNSTTDDPIVTRRSIELVTYSAGRVNLGEIRIGLQAGGAGSRERIALGHVQVIENMRPRFYAKPFRASLARLDQEYERALASGLGSVGVVGSGGSGKSRLCEEFALERRRRGSSVVSAKQAKTLDDPHRVLADLFVGLVPESRTAEDPVDAVVQAIARYDGALARNAELAIRAVFGDSRGRSGPATEQSVLSSLLLLLVAQGRRVPLVVHLQDLHWCTSDVLRMLERLVWQLQLVLSAPDATPRTSASGILFVFEGRSRERQSLGDDGWVSEPFETFLQKLDCPLVSCNSFDPAESLEFISRLFEDRYSARRQLHPELQELQHELVEDIDRASGGNPFHSLQQVQLLRDRGVIGQNPKTGLLYLIQPEPDGSLLPKSVFEAIELRWQYLRMRSPEVALLLWAVALLEDRLPTELFRQLWRELAPDASMQDIDATEMLWTGSGEEHEVSFRHENYFHSLRRFELPTQERARAVTVYADWFAAAKALDPADRFRWARVVLQFPQPDFKHAKMLLRTALRDARRREDLQLARRISSTLLDLFWSEDARASIPLTQFLRQCDNELALVEDLLGSDRFQAAHRLEELRRRLEARHSGGRGVSARRAADLQLRWLTAEMLRSQHLFNDRQPTLAAEIAERVVGRIQVTRPGLESAADGAWTTLEMEALHTQAVALALCGEIDQALRTSELAVDAAWSSSSPSAQHIISTYANILLARDPAASEALLRQCLAKLDGASSADDARDAAEINLSMALTLRAHQLKPARANEVSTLLSEARELLVGVFTRSFQLGNYPDAGASSLMLGIVSALQGDGDEMYWFAQAVAASARGHQPETLWRSHINLATATYHSRQELDDTARDHARAALEIMEETLSPYSQPEQSPRFGLIRAPLVQAVRFLLMNEDQAGLAALERYPVLRTSFANARTGALREDDDSILSHEWLRIEGEGYVLY